MSQESTTNKSANYTIVGAAMGIGLVVGGIMGLLIDNLAFSAGGGMILGLAFGLALEKKRQAQ